MYPASLKYDLKTSHSQQVARENWNQRQVIENSEYQFNPGKMRSRSVFKSPENWREAVVYMTLFSIAVRVQYACAQNTDEVENNDQLAIRNNRTFTYPKLNSHDLYQFNNQFQETSTQQVFSNPLTGKARIRKKRKEEPKKQEPIRFSQNPMLRINFGNAQKLQAKIKYTAQYSFNRAPGSEIKVSENKFSITNGALSSEEMAKTEATLNDMMELGVANHLRTSTLLQNQLTEHIEKISGISQNDAHLLKVNLIEFFTNLQKHVIEATIAEQYGGGNCRFQTSIAIVEAIRRNIPIKHVELVDPEGQSHVFAVIGRERFNVMGYVRTLKRLFEGDCAVLDYWAYGGPIPCAQILQNMSNYLYSYSRWIPKVEEWTDNMLTSITAPFRDKYPNNSKLGKFITFCENKYLNLLKNGIFMPVSIINGQLTETFVL